MVAQESESSPTQERGSTYSDSHVNNATGTQSGRPTKFEPVNLKETRTIDCGLPPEIWTIVQAASADFAPQFFLDVSRNLLENPNLTASHLSRAELSYKSFTDSSFNPNAKHPHELASIIKHLKPDHQPWILSDGVPGYSLEWTVVRKLIPRNPKLDEALLQTCHLYTSTAPVLVQEKGISKTINAERYLVVYIPHASDADSIPFYHPKVRGVAILYMYQVDSTENTVPGTLSLYYDLFPENPLDNRMSRTALKMLEIIHKHARGRVQGYQKRVYHDIIIPQKTFQDTYVFLKGKYAKELIEGWVEQTPAGKHVFEDLGIAAFLIELWTDMYGSMTTANSLIKDSEVKATRERDELSASRRHERAQQAFPGFVDVGCGNGLLVYILNREGWNGWGFDARKRKTWDSFEKKYQEKLKEMLLVPVVLQPGDPPPETSQLEAPLSHNGMFPKGTFIVSNHADELTVWTPILAYLSDSAFISIPCCSHDFGGTRFRAPHHPEHLPTAPTKSSGKQVSAYTSLCSYVAHITSQVSFIPEKEHLRIPSTRNIAIVGKKRQGNTETETDLDGKLRVARELVAKEMGGETSIEQVRRQWLKRGSGLLKPDKGGH